MIATIPDAAQALIRTAKLFEGVREKPGNRGIVPDFCSWFVISDSREYPIGGLGAPWCSSSAITIGRLAVGEAWPIPISPAMSDVDQVVSWAKAHHVFHRRSEDGDLIVFRRGVGWGHVGIVISAYSAEEVITLEGNSNEQGSREGTGFYRLVRPVNENTAFVRWVNALQ
jgi:hypothetical protein